MTPNGLFRRTTVAGFVVVSTTGVSTDVIGGFESARVCRTRGAAARLDPESDGNSEGQPV
jgi:hypothetical protein